MGTSPILALEIETLKIAWDLVIEIWDFPVPAFWGLGFST
jgi:hypothetical protein